MPPSVAKRLRDAKSARDNGDNRFTSALGSTDFLLLLSEGYESLGPVMGSTVFQIRPPWFGGWLREAKTNLKTGCGWELGTDTEAWNDARAISVERMRHEASILGAELIAAVAMRGRAIRVNGIRGVFAWEMTVRGTALRTKGVKAPESAVATNLSAPDLFALRRAGYQPQGLVFGDSVYFHGASSKSSQQMTVVPTAGGTLYDRVARSFAPAPIMVNDELADVTAAVYTARDLAMKRLDARARETGAEGVVGVRHETHIREIYVPEISKIPGTVTKLEVHFFVLGTAVVKSESAPEVAVVTPVVENR